jgi:5-methylcytosine-specific restriction endonuclease McrA
LNCSPFAGHNTSKIAPGAIPEERARTVRTRRLASYTRYGRQRRRRRKRELVALFGGACMECGYALSVAALEFHHRNATTKEFSIAKFGGSNVKLMAEAAKCDLLCANCHRKRHARVGEHADPTAASIRRSLKQRAVICLGGLCDGCDREYPLSIFEFHHRDGGSKDFGISEDGRIRRWDEIEAELAKCLLLCANCHREVHAGLRALDDGLLGFAEDALPYVA